MRCGEKGYHHTSKFYNETKFYSLAEAMSDKNILLNIFLTQSFIDYNYLYIINYYMYIIIFNIKLS